MRSTRNVMLATVALALVSGSVGAANHMKLDSRFDYENKHYKEDRTSSSTTADYAYFKVNRLILNAYGDLAEDLKYQFEYNFKTYVAGNKANIHNSVRTAAITKDFNQNLTTIVGFMQNTVGGGTEAKYSGSDVYSTSYIYQRTVGCDTNTIGNTIEPSYNCGTTFNPETSSVTGLPFQGTTTSYRPAGAGVRANYKLGSQVLVAQIMNSQSNNIPGYAFEYQGSMMNGMIKPFIGYNTTKRSVKNFDGSYNLQSYGLKLSMGSFIVDLDHMRGTQGKAGTEATDGAKRDIRDRSSIMRVTYKGEHFRPMLAYFRDDTLDKGNRTHSLTRWTQKTWEAALQYYPKKDDNFRYHFAMNRVKKEYYLSQDPTTGAGVLYPEYVTIWAGIKYNVDIL